MNKRREKKKAKKLKNLLLGYSVILLQLPSIPSVCMTSVCVTVFLLSTDAWDPAEVCSLQGWEEEHGHCVFCSQSHCHCLPQSTAERRQNVYESSAHSAAHITVVRMHYKFKHNSVTISFIINNNIFRNISHSIPGTIFCSSVSLWLYFLRKPTILNIHILRCNSWYQCITEKNH